MKPFRQHVAIAVDGGIKGVIGITEGPSVNSVSFSVFSDSNFGWLTGEKVVVGNP